MMKLIKRFRKLCFKKRQGMSIVETLLLIIVVAFTVGAMLQTTYVTSQMQIAGRKYVESHKSMVSFFQAVEAVDSGDIMSGNLKNTVKDIIPTESFVNISKIQAVSNDRVATVSITLTDSDKKSKVVYSDYNVFSHRTVADVKDRRR